MGFSLMEMLIVVSVIGLLSLFMLPKSLDIIRRGEIKGARNHITNKFYLARSAARQNAVETRLVKDGNVILVERLGTPMDTVGGVQNLNSLFGVTSTSSDTVRIDPRGLMQNAASVTMAFGRNGLRDSVVFFGFGGLSR
jgi:prepilin-type N-terminal cleavage/methylation domain-containing protein